MSLTRYRTEKTMLAALAAAAFIALLPACGGGHTPDSEVEDTAADTDEPEAALAGVAPVAAAASASGFAAKVTGGGSGEVVTASTPAELARLLSDDTPRTIKLESIIDFSSRTLSQGPGCLTPNKVLGDKACPSPRKREIMLTLRDFQKPYCDGQPKTTYPYDPAGVEALQVGSNKTLLGVGPNAGIKGKGLILRHNDRSAVRNVIIRNLSITDINEGRVWGGDALTISEADGVWIDHNRFARVGRQFLVTGDGSATAKVDNLTISNNEFDGTTDHSIDCGGRHYWNILLYGNGKVSMVGNWLHDVDGRAPKIISTGTGALVQVVNNLFENGGGHALDYEGDPTRVLVEGNQFLNVALPVAGSNDPAHHGQMFGFYKQTASTISLCKQAIGRQCNPNVASPAPRDSPLAQDAAAIGAMTAYAAQMIRPYATASVASTVRARAGVEKKPASN